MASRIVFLPAENNSSLLFQEKVVNFEWVAGIAKSQAIKSIKNLHLESKKLLKIMSMLEISTKSNNLLGFALSAFNLKISHEDTLVLLESLYQASKVFEGGGPFLDLIVKDPITAKQDTRLRINGNISGYKYENISWPVKKSPNFYDFLYIKALLQFPDRRTISDYEAFTDIAFSQTSLNFNPKRSYNCQARSVAIYRTLVERMEEKEILSFLAQVCTKEDSGSTHFIQGYLDE